MTDWAASERAFLDDLAGRPAARPPATLGEIWRTEWARSGLDTPFGVRAPLKDAYDELAGAIEAAHGKSVPELLRDRGQSLIDARSYEDRAKLILPLADELPEEKRKALEPLRDVRKRASDKAQELERRAADVSAAAYGLSGVATMFAAGVARQMVDPAIMTANVVTAGIGGPLSGSILTMIGRQAAAGAVAQAAVEPFVQGERAGLGLEAGFGRAAVNVSEAALGSGALALLFRGAAAGFRALRPPAESPGAISGAPRPDVSGFQTAISEAPSVAAAGADRAVGAPPPQVASGPATVDLLGRSGLEPEDLAAAAALAERDAVISQAGELAPAARQPAQVREAVEAAAAAIEEGRPVAEAPPPAPEPRAATTEAHSVAEPAAPARPAEPVGVAVPVMQAHRVTAADGTAIEVTPRIVEASALKASADAGYDPSLQPRQRDRAASQAQVREIASNLDPERLGYSAEAAFGAPIVGPDLMVESGNGRVMALRAVYAAGGEKAAAYRAFLERQGADLTGFKEPVLVRERTTELTPEGRRDFTLAANQATTLAFSASERALADARMLTPEVLDLIRNTDDLAAIGNRDFVRAFMAALPAAERGTMITPEGGLSAEGLTRIRNAVLAAAYGDAPVLVRIAEATDDEVKSISNALVAAAPLWAKLRAEVAADRVRLDMDLTAALMEAVTRTADLRARRQKLDAFLRQQDAFDQLPAPVEAFMRMFYDAKGRRAAGAPRIADALRFYAEEALKVTEGGLDLGLAPVTPADVQRLAGGRVHGGQQTETDLFAGGGNGDGAGGRAPGAEVRRSGAEEGGAGSEGAGLGGAATGADAADAAQLTPAQRAGQILTALQKNNNQWFELPEGRIYIRRGTRPDYGQTLELANIEIGEAQRGQGIFTKYLTAFERAAADHGYDFIYVEAVIEPRFREFFRRRGYEMVAGTDRTGYPDFAKRAPIGTKTFIEVEPLTLSSGEVPGKETPRSSALSALASASNNYGRARREINDLVSLLQRNSDDADRLAHWQDALSELQDMQRQGLKVRGHVWNQEDWENFSIHGAGEPLEAVGFPDGADTTPVRPGNAGAADAAQLTPLARDPAQRADLQALLDRGAGPAEIEAHPIIQEAYRIGRAFPETTELPGYGTPEFRANRKVNLGDREAVGYEAAQDYLYEQAQAASTAGPVRRDRRATIVMGPGGSGKSTLMDPLARARFAAIVDADEAKKVLPEYRGGIGASAVHEESTVLMYGEGSPMERLVGEGANVLIQKIGHTIASLHKLRELLERNGYTVDLINLTVDPEEAFRRRTGRYLRTGRVNSRPFEEMIVENGLAPKQNYLKLKEEGLFNEYADVDVNQRPARLLDGEGTQVARDIGFEGQLLEPGSRRGAGPGNVRDAGTPGAEARSGQAQALAPNSSSTIELTTPAPKGVGDPVLAREADRVLAELGDVEIVLVNPDGTTRTVSARQALSEADEDAAAAAALSECIGMEFPT